MRVGYLTAAIGAAVLAASVSIAPARASTNWQGYTYAPAALASYKGLERLADQLREATKGEVNITVSPGGAMSINGNDIAQAVGDGILQFGGTGGYAGYVPIGGIGRLPMLYETKEEFDRAYAILEPYLKQALEAKNVVLVGHYVYPVQTVWSRTAVDGMDQMKDVKFRVVSPEQAAAVKLFGAVPVSMSTPDVASALQRGAIDMLLTAAAGGGKLWYEMLDTNYKLPVNWSLSLIIANKEAFDDLTAEQQAAVMKAGADAGAWITKTFQEEDQAYTEKFEAAGLKVVQPTPAEVAKARALVQPYWDEWAASHSAEAKEALSKIRTELGK